MPGRRNLARERAQHDSAARFASLYATLTSQLPQLDRALVGHDAILRYLHDTLLLRRANHRPITWRIALQWRRDHGLPILRGFTARRYASPALSTTFALTAWTLSQFSSGDYLGLRLSSPHLPQTRERSSQWAA